ncbi:MAG: tetratricopeptide repeat protein [Cyanobacteria bacterium]|nr:tetratricopeptide repeat protein [Cyanobacteriota bacterium]MDW8201203.1 tetratricopeptide repeat protein [Cyanobacteriota bacterium SKYGB_h_bin112]
MEQDGYQQGLEKLKMGDRQGALQAFDHALQIDPQRAEVYAKRATLRRDLGDRDGALADYHRALQLQPTAEAHLGRALLYLAMGEPQAAMLDAEQALCLSPNLPAAHNVLGTAYCKQHNIPQAIAAYKTAAKLYLSQKDKTNAQRCLDTINQLQADSALPSSGVAASVATKPWINLDQFFQQAMAKVQQGNYRDALADLDWLILTDPQNAKAYCQRGIVHAKVGRRKAAIHDLTEAIRLAPHDSQMLLHRAMVRLELEDARGAIDDLNQLVSTQDPKVYLQRGNAYRQLQDYRQAIADYSRVLNLVPTMPEPYYQRGLAREAFGDRAGAISDLQQAANLWLNQGDGDSYQRTLEEIKALQAKPIQVPVESSATQPLDIAEIDRCNQLWDRLLRMVSGNREIAERLLAIAQERYPGKSEAWYLEKVIFDLESDR